MTRHQRRMAALGAAAAGEAARLRIGRLTLEGVSPHVGRRIAESLERGLASGIAAPEAAGRRFTAEGARGPANLTVRELESPEDTGARLAALVLERVRR